MWEVYYESMGTVELVMVFPNSLVHNFLNNFSPFPMLWLEFCHLVMNQITSIAYRNQPNRGAGCGSVEYKLRF